MNEDGEERFLRSATRPTRLAAAETASPRPPRVPLARSLSIPRRPGFEPNQGQWPSAVTYVARDGEATLFLTPTEAVWRLHGTPGHRAPGSHGSAAAGAVRMRWLGANPAPLMVGSAPRPTRINYIRGHDPAAWRYGIPLYGRATYRNLYPGVDLVFHDEHGALEYDLVVAPGANAGVIRLRFDGAQSAAVDTTGELTLRSVGGDIIHRRLVAYQEAAGVRQPVRARYRVYPTAGTDRTGVEVAFAIGSYDRTRPLIIDPQVGYATKIDSISNVALDADVDSNGNLWLVGTTTNAQFPVTDDAIYPGKNEFDDGYVVKLDAQGRLVYATYLGGNSIDCMGGLAIDQDGNVILGGTTVSEDFPVTPNAAQSLHAGGQGDGFLVKLDAAGQLLYASYFGGTGTEACSSAGSRINDVAAAPDGSIYFLIGTTTSNELPAAGAVGDNLNANFFLGRFDSDLRAQWGRFRGSPGFVERTSRLRVDPQGNAYVIGDTGHVLGAQHEFPTTPGAFQTTSESDGVKFIVKYDRDGNVVYSTFLGATTGPGGSAFAADLDVDPSGNAYVAMVAGTNSMPITSNAFQTTIRGGLTDLYVAKLDPTGSQLVYGTFLGGTSDEVGDGDHVSLAVDESGHAYVAAATFSSDFPLRDPFVIGTSSLTVTKLTPDASDLVYSSYVRQGVQALALHQGALYVAGVNIDGFGIGVTKIDDAGAPPCPGDCDGDGVVRVNELVIGVGIALGQQAASACAAFDADGNGQVTIAELIAAVGSLLNGCV